MEQDLPTTTTPTFGIEIEIPWRAMLNRFDHGKASRILREQGGFYNLTGTDKAYVQKVMNHVDAKYLERVAVAAEQGVPVSGNDGWKEFALRPRHDPKDILRDVQTLQNLDLVRDNEQYPLHLTIGNLAVNGDAYYLLASTEIYGDIRPARFTQQRTWAQKGRGGVKWRFSHELQLDTSKGVEFRTLEYTSMAQLSDMLHVAEAGSHAIIEDHYLWQSWREQLAQHFTAADLPTGAIWQNTNHDLWQRYANTLSSSQWQQEAKRIIGRHAALLSLVGNDTRRTSAHGRDHRSHDDQLLQPGDGQDGQVLRPHESAHQ